MEKKILVTKSSIPSLDEYVNEIKDIFDSHWLTNNGPKFIELKDKIKDYLDVDNIDLVVNGHAALELSLDALGLKGEVITTPFTFISTTHSIVRSGLTPVFCDIDPDTYCIDPNKIESLITDKTCAIMPVHVYGNICDVEKIEDIAKRHNLKVIYDAAHTFGETYKGVGVGNFGDVSCFSFHATKVFNTIEGGCVTSKDKNLIDKIFTSKDFGIYDEETISNIGPNAKINEFCCAMGLCNLRHVDEEINKRKKVVERYRENLKDIEGIKLNIIQEDVKSNYAYFPVVFDKDKFGKDRNEVFKSLLDNGISARKYFYPIASEVDCYKDRYDSSKTPIALKISQSILTLPLYADLDLDDVDRICDIIKSK